MKSNRRRKQSARPPEGGLSRREFARGATVAAAAIAAIPGGMLGAALPSLPGSAVPALPQEAGGEKPKLSPEALAEVEAKVAEILRRYGDRLNEQQKTDLRRLVREAQAPLEALRAFPLANSDEPATILHLAGPSRAGARARGTAGTAKTPATPAAKPGA
jgi:hypothetical protein